MIDLKNSLNFWRRLSQPWLILLILSGNLWTKQVLAIEPIPFESSITKNGICRADLTEGINQIIDQDKFERSRWGILVEVLDSKETLYALEEDKYFIPASNAKILTTAAVLLKFGSQFRLETPIYITGNFPHLQTLKLVGKGDPSLTTDQLNNLVKFLKIRGITKIDNLIVEEDNIDDSGIESTWEWEDIHYYYATAVNDLILNENAIILKLIPQEIGEPLKLQWSDPIAAQQWQVKNNGITGKQGTPNSIEIKENFGQPMLNIEGELAVDSQPDIFGLAVVNPRNYFLESLKNIFIQEGITINNSTISEAKNNDYYGSKLTSIKSEKLAVLISKTNQESNNIFAESLLKLLADNNEDISKLEGLEETLTQLGVDPNSYQLKDGSGLSRQNLVTPSALVTTLRLMSETREAQTYRESLAIGGVKGTLKNRFKETSIEGNLQGKTGTLTGSSTLSGYLTSPNYSDLVFSIMVNQSDVPVSEIREAIDSIILRLGQIKKC
ncbi:MAG TPA: D-alanyl-D-alanine carboxypeptidase/D-alanyl-D-alanine-endopeptidase [Cyanothece sp. UBA12306]|nr:D-alanyl-D-alanine carboxypeptidase/D-alanyl-D-alanine-endopeptidase [Cyanothece sp. UBA12306]